MDKENELPDNIADLPGIQQVSAVKQHKKVRGRPIQPGEMARRMQLSAAHAKKMRKEARAAMLQAMCTKLNLGDELVDAIRKNDATKMSIVEKALTIVGLTHNQSSEAIAQRLELKSDANVKQSGTLEVVVKGLNAEGHD